MRLLLAVIVSSKRARIFLYLRLCRAVSGRCSKLRGAFLPPRALDGLLLGAVLGIGVQLGILGRVFRGGHCGVRRR